MSIQMILFEIGLTLLVVALVIYILSPKVRRFVGLKPFPPIPTKGDSLAAAAVAGEEKPQHATGENGIDLMGAPPFSEPPSASFYWAEQEPVSAEDVKAALAKFNVLFRPEIESAASVIQNRGQLRRFVHDCEVRLSDKLDSDFSEVITSQSASVWMPVTLLAIIYGTLRQSTGRMPEDMMILARALDRTIDRVAQDLLNRWAPHKTFVVSVMTRNHQLVVRLSEQTPLGPLGLLSTCYTASAQQEADLWRCLCTQVMQDKLTGAGKDLYGAQGGCRWSFDGNASDWLVAAEVFRAPK